MLEDKSSRTETTVYIDGQRFIQITIKDYYGNIIFSNLIKQ